MTKDINTGDTQDTNSGETATYRDTVDNAGTYDNAGTVDLQDAQEFATSAAVNTTGWTIQITHPVSGRTIRPDAINPDQVQYIPGPNTVPTIRMPVRRAPSWLREEFDDNPDMTVHLDGEQLPIDELVDVELEEGQTILVGEGGTELRATVQAEYEAEERPTAATDLVSANTSYDVVDNTAAAQPDTITVQTPSGESELLNALSAADDFPIIGTNGGIKPAQICWTTEGENDTTRSGTTTYTGAGFEDFSGGTARGFSGLASDITSYIEWEFTPSHRIPEQHVKVQVRDDNREGDNTPEVDWILNGSRIDTLPQGADVNLSWTDVGDGDFEGQRIYNGGPLEAGTTYTLRAEVNAISSDQSYAVDVVAPFDGRYEDQLFFDDDNGGNAGYLDGPETHADIDTVFDTYESAFSVVGGSATVTITDTSNDQALALSNDFGGTYPISGSNTTSVSGTFPSTGASLQLRATLSRYSPNGARDQTPRFGYDAQRLDAYELEADVAAESLLIDQTFSNNLANILGQILGSQYGWAITNEDGTTTFTVDEPGSTVADRDPEVSESQITKKVQTYSDVKIKGSTIPVSGEQFQASTSFVSLAEDDILTGSEAVYDSGGTNYVRGVDYSMSYQSGEIRALSGGDLTVNDNYQIDYQHQISATYNVPGQSGDTLTRTINGVVSDRQAKQIAYVLAEVDPALKSPRYEGSIVVPRLDAAFDPLEGLELEDKDLPDVATPLSIRGEPQLTPLGLNLQLGSKPRLEEALSNIREQVNSISDRV